MYTRGTLHMDEQRQDDQLDLTYSSSVPIRDVTLMTYRKQWTTGKGGERGSETSVLIALLHTHNIRMCEIDIGNLKTRNSRNWFRYETFYYLWVKGYSTWGERNIIFLCWLLLHRHLSTQPTRGARSAQRRLASPSSESQPSSSEAGTQLTAFSQISAHASGAWRHPNTLVPNPIWDFYFEISEWYILSARAWTPALMLHLTNPCDKRKVLSLTKPKGKMYKTKSHGHYITAWHDDDIYIYIYSSMHFIILHYD